MIEFWWFMEPLYYTSLFCLIVAYIVSALSNEIRNKWIDRLVILLCLPIIAASVLFIIQVVVNVLLFIWGPYL